MKSLLLRLLAFLAGLGILITLMLSAVQLVAFDRGRYERAYQQYDRASVIGIDEQELMAVTDQLLDYLRGRAPSLEMEATILGERQPVFGKRELLHMEDVQKLFTAGFSLRRAAMILALCGIILLFFLQKRRMLYMLSWGYIAALGCFILFAAVVGVAMAADFTRAFTIFHELLFTNDLWLLDPYTDVLIQMFPQVFFEEMAAAILGWMSFAVLVPAVPALIYGIYQKRKARRTV